MTVAIGFLQLSIALLLLHRVVPTVYHKSKACPMRVMMFGFGIASFGMESIITGIGYPAPSLLHICAQIAFAIGGILWILKWPRAELKKWTDVK